MPTNPSKSQNKLGSTRSFDELLERAREYSEHGFGYPRFVEREFEKFLACGHLVERVLPAVPYRQWVLSLPRHVRFLRARHGDLLTRVLGVFLRKVFAWQRRPVWSPCGSSMTRPPSRAPSGSSPAKTKTGS